MKKSKLLMLAVLLTACVAMFCACNLFVDAKEIVIEAMPKTSYVTTDTDFDWTNFQLKVIYKSKEPKTYSYADLQAAGSFKVSKFDNSVGTHTATINYLGCSVSFAYTVADKLFAGGEGTAANPYQIATAEQFANIGVNTGKTYFKLINDIDLTNYETIETIGNAVIDGAAYSLRNVSKTIANVLYASTLENVDIYINTRGSLFGEFGNSGDSEEVVISSVNIYGVYDRLDVTGQNMGMLVNYVTTLNCTIEDVSVYANYLTNTVRGAIFVGYSNYYGGTLTFNNAKFYGYAQGRNIAVFMANASGGVSSWKVQPNRTININGDSGNYGTMVATEMAPAALLYVGSAYVTVKDDGTELTKNTTGIIPVVEIGDFNKNTVQNLHDDNLKLTVVDGKFNVAAAKNEAATSYKIAAEVWTQSYTNVESTTERGTNTFTLMFEDVAVGATNVYVASWKLDRTIEEAYSYDEANKVYKFNDFVNFGSYVKTGSEFSIYDGGSSVANLVKYIVYAYNAQGRLLGTYTYAA